MGNTSLNTLIQIPSHLIGFNSLYCIETRKSVQINCLALKITMLILYIHA